MQFFKKGPIRGNGVWCVGEGVPVPGGRAPVWMRPELGAAGPRRDPTGPPTALRTEVTRRAEPEALPQEPKIHGESTPGFLMPTPTWVLAQQDRLPKLWSQQALRATVEVTREGARTEPMHRGERAPAARRDPPTPRPRLRTQEDTGVQWGPTRQP